MSESYVGEIRMFAGNFPPQGWAFCDGSELPISENDVLFAVLGTTYGGDGVNTFALPDLRGRIPLHMGQSNQFGTTYVQGQKGGSENVTLTANQMPIHTHAVNAQSATGTADIPTNAVWAKGTIKQYSTNAPDGTMMPSLLGSVGGGQPHDNMMPYLPVSFIISLYGIYPQQN